MNQIMSVPDEQETELRPMTLTRTDHALWTQGALHQVSDGDGADEGGLQRKEQKQNVQHFVLMHFK